MRIDLVYLWVDGNDTEWLKRKNALLGTSDTLSKDATNACRFISNDELKYSLRSVEQNAPWINNIYIITDNQVPHWLNENNSKVKIINHTEIIPNEYLPLYNSCAIETRIPYIPNLAENFIYANDDMFIWNPVEKEFFFDSDKVVCRFGKKLQNRTYKHIYGHTIQRAYELIKSKFEVNVPYFPHHGIDAYKKSVFLDCINEFPQEFNETLSHRFREFSDLQRIIILYYTIAQQKGNIKAIRANWLDKFLNKALESEFYELKKSNLKRITTSKAKLMCINDSRKTTDNDRKFMREFLETKFPNKSAYEK